MQAILFKLILPLLVMTADPTPPAPAPAKPVVVFPKNPKVEPPKPAPAPAPEPGPTPAPAPAVEPPTKVGFGQFYVVKSTVPLFLTTSPVGYVKIAEEKGPMKLKGVFVGGTGEVETRTYTADDIVYTIELLKNVPAGTKFELLGFYEGLKDEKDILRERLITVGGVAPKPDEEEIDPNTDPDVQRLAAEFKAVWTYEPEDEKGNIVGLRQMYLDAVKYADDKSLVTWNDLVGKMGERATELKFAGTLQHSQKVLAVELKKTLPFKADAAKQPIDADGRKAAKAAYAKVAAALALVK